MRSTLVVLGLFCAISLQAKTLCLEIALRENGDRLSLESSEGSSRPSLSRKAIAADFRVIYEALENHSKLKGKVDDLIQKLSKELLAPLAAQIQSASCVVFQINQSQKYYALDLLFAGQDPLFVEKPVAFAFRKDVDFTKKLRQDAKGLILRDPDADPENGTGKANEMFPGSKFKLMKQTNPGIFSGSVDFVLVSGHGSVTLPWENSDDADDDSIGFNDDDLTADILGKTKHTLTYLDSCQLGMSQDFISASRKAGSSYYLAPIVSNEAGNSSTRTIKYFFGALRDGQTPMLALHTARKKLYNEFKNKASRENLLYYAYPFRLYGL
ncbi:MAG: hypothetical protein K8S54_16875 [Spirochaetia bacterium]|nr:hypothetical protein [Spirochaetia bacterium]